MFTSEFSIRGDFPPATHAEWRLLAEESLRGASFDRKMVTRTYDGIAIQPIYTSADWPFEGDPSGFPAAPPFVRGARRPVAAVEGWDLCQEHASAEVRAANRAILEDLRGGVTSLQLRLDEAARRGFDPDDAAAAELAGRGGLMCYSVDDLDAALAGADLRTVGISLDAGAAFSPAAAMLIGLWQRRAVPAEDCRGAFNADPMAVLAREGSLPLPLPTALEAMTDLVTFTADRFPRVTAVAVDTSPYHDAGATAAQDVAIAMATAVSYLRSLTAGTDIDTAASQFVFRISLGSHIFRAIGKLRAARRLWGRVVEASGGSIAAAAMRVHARTAARVLTRRDPDVNMLRNTAAVFAAAVGGAEVITSVPFDSRHGTPDQFSRRVARNTLHVLRDEAGLNRVVDPAGGSWFLERLTDQLAAKAWEEFQAIERRGGMLAALQSGWIAGRIDQAYQRRLGDIVHRRHGITGVTEFPNVDEGRIDKPPPDLASIRAAAREQAAKRRSRIGPPATFDSGERRTEIATGAGARGATIGQLSRAYGLHADAAVTVPNVPPRNLAEPFERLRDASDRWLAKHGQRPAVFLAKMGTAADYTARAAYAANFFGVGGLAVVGEAGFDDAESAADRFADSGLGVVVVCSSDERYLTLIPEIAPRLKAAGARSVIVVGNPRDSEDSWIAAGVDRCIFMGCDMLAVLGDVLREEGVPRDD